MKIEKGKIVAATEDELFSLYLKREMDAIMPFTEYKERMKQLAKERKAKERAYKQKLKEKERARKAELEAKEKARKQKNKQE